MSEERGSRAALSEPAPRSARLKYLWLAVPLLGLAELGAQLYFSHRFPTIDEWKGVAPEVAKWKRAGDLIVVAPEWADPMARLAFGDRLMPISETARPDDSGYARALEIGALGRGAAELADWPVVEEHAAGSFTLRVRKNPHFAPVSRVLIDRAEPPELSVSELIGGQPHECPFVEAASPSSGGLLAPPMYPRRRFRCGAAETSFVGLTIIEDEGYRPHRCLWANSGLGDVVLTFKAVRLGKRVHGAVGQPYFMVRDTAFPPAVITTLIDGVEVGRYEHHAEQGFQSFDVPTAAYDGRSADLSFRIASHEPRAHQVCLYADIR